jgi:hypothetical protein
MAFSIRSTRASSEPLVDQPVGLHPDWSERMVIAVAASVAVMIVAAIAVLMGMA